MIYLLSDLFGLTLSLLDLNQIKMNLSSLLDLIQVESFALFMLVLLLTATTAISFVLMIIRNIMPFGGGYAPGLPYAAPQAMPQRSGSSGFGLFFLLLIAAILLFFFVSYENKMEQPAPPNRVQYLLKETKPEEKVINQTPRRPEFSIEDIHTTKRPIVSGELNRGPQATAPAPPPTPPQVAPKPSPAPIYYGIQTGAFASQEAASQQKPVRKTRQKTYVVEGEGQLYQVIVGRFETREKAEKYQRRKSLEGFIISYTVE